MPGRFSLFARGINSPAQGAVVITPNDTTMLSEPIRSLTIGTAGGTISFIGLDGQTYQTGPLPVGSYPMEALRINATGTTATGLTGWV